MVGLGIKGKRRNQDFYKILNYCRRCELAFPKDILKCTECHSMVRTKPRYKSARKKRLNSVKRY